MKTRFNNRELCHVWAQQTQSEGRGSNMFFRDSRIYSYGEHYLAARIHDVRGEKVVLINNRNYSVTTQKHLSYIRNAITGTTFFRATNPDDIKSTIPVARQSLENTFLRAEKVRKIETRHDVTFQLNQITFAQSQLDLALTLNKRKPHRRDHGRFSAVAKRLNDLVDRYNSPEKQAARAKKEAEKQAELRQYLAVRIAEFRSGGLVSWDLVRLDFDLLRVKEGRLQTSRNASVDLKDAMMLYAALKAGKNVVGARVGSYTISEVTDEAVKVGCHTFLKTELDNVLGGLI